ncbi:MAG: hypothetical protein LBR77_10360, partial [Lachnospiraceae bacterium]|nr:hypothetical protein [Lachnospiraceae bacterium]
MKLEKYYENPQILHLNCEEPRSYFIPYAPDDEHGIVAGAHVHVSACGIGDAPDDEHGIGAGALVHGGDCGSGYAPGDDHGIGAEAHVHGSNCGFGYVTDGEMCASSRVLDLGGGWDFRYFRSVDEFEKYTCFLHDGYAVTDSVSEKLPAAAAGESQLDVPSAHVSIDTGTDAAPQVDTLPTDAMSVDVMPVDVMPVDALPTDTLPTDTLPTDALPTDAQPVNVQPVDALTGCAPYRGFSRIQVPGCIQNQGYDRHQYTNVDYPFPYDPPYVPDENPACHYHRVFVLSAGDMGFSHYINFDGVDSCLYLYINHRFVGYSQVSHSVSEWDITQFVRGGENHIDAVVLKWCDGSYLEDQDKFRHTGIFRDVYILKRPRAHVRDFFVKTALAPDYQSARVEVDLAFHADTPQSSCTLYDAHGKEVAGASGVVICEGSPFVPAAEITAKMTFDVKDMRLWSAESPYLYTLKLVAGDEVIYQKVGFRDIHVKDRVIYINGQKVKFKGVNRHDSDPVTGATISVAQALTDLRMMKAANINAIRTSHYPNAPWFPQLADEMGFYLIAEADLESHGSAAVYGGSQEETFGNLVQMEIFSQAILDRNIRNVQRDKNHPSVIFWSMGNEAGYSKAFEDTGRWIKAFDPSRLLHYESSIWETGGHKNDASMIDVYSRMYPSVDVVEDYLAHGDKPMILCEFSHAMGNGPGDFEDYWAMAYANDAFAGAFVWEWCDHAVLAGMAPGTEPANPCGQYRADATMPAEAEPFSDTANRCGHGITVPARLSELLPRQRAMYRYGGDSGEFPHCGNFCVDGMVFPDRRPHPAYHEYRNVLRPVRARLVSFVSDGAHLVRCVIELENKLDFLNLKDVLDVEAHLCVDGVSSGVARIAAPDVPAHGTGVFMVEFPGLLPQDQATLSLRLEYVSIGGKGWMGYDRIGATGFN